jgi:hypothetical protein
MIGLTTILAALKAKSLGQLSMPKSGVALFILSIFMIIASLFLIFASNQMRTLGVQVYISGIIGAFATMSGAKAALPVFLFFTAFTFLCSIGSLAIFSHDNLIYAVTQAECATFFGNVTSIPKRCEGYLEWMWILTTFLIYVIGLSVVLAFATFAGFDEQEDAKEQKSAAGQQGENQA